jgi:hypothetical protein
MLNYLIADGLFSYLISVIWDDDDRVEGGLVEFIISEHSNTKMGKELSICFLFGNE